MGFAVPNASYSQGSWLPACGRGCGAGTKVRAGPEMVADGIPRLLSTVWRTLYQTPPPACRKASLPHRGHCRRRDGRREGNRALQRLGVQALGAAGPPQGGRAPPWGWGEAEARPGRRPMVGSGLERPMAGQGSAVGTWRRVLLRHCWDRDWQLWGGWHGVLGQPELSLRPFAVGGVPWLLSWRRLVPQLHAPGSWPCAAVPLQFPCLFLAGEGWQLYFKSS